MPPTKSDSPLPENTQGRHYTLKSAPLSSQPLDQSRPMRQIDPPNRSEIAQVGLVFHRAWPDLQRMKLLLPVARSCRVSFLLEQSMREENGIFRSRSSGDPTGGACDGHAEPLSGRQGRA